MLAATISGTLAVKIAGLATARLFRNRRIAPFLGGIVVVFTQGIDFGMNLHASILQDIPRPGLAIIVLACADFAGKIINVAPVFSPTQMQ
tara:strand:+ start:857 stop:1126 length:270 start_codon:yes stop_codon:yes gene_type:complete